MAAKKVVEEVVEEFFDEDVVEIELAEEVEEPELVEAETVSNEGNLYIRAYPSDNYLTVAERHKPEDISVKDFARMIMELNGNAPVRANSRIRIR